MRRVRVTIVTAVLGVVAALGITAGSVVPAGADASPQQQATADKAEQLVSKFLDLLAPDTPTAKLDAFLSPAFTLQRADGTSLGKSEYLDEPAVVDSYEISDLTATRTGPVIVARYTIVTDATIDGKQQASDPAPRLSVFVKGPDGWQLVAHANFSALESTDATTTTTT